MASVTGRRRQLGLAVLATALATGACGRSGPSPAPPGTGSPAPPPGAVTVTGAERLAWAQDGVVSALGFRAYVNGNPVALDAATCDTATPVAQCSAPLPPLADGVHRITLTAVALYAEQESARSEEIVVQKVSSRASVSAASFPDASAAASAPSIVHTVSAASGVRYTVDVVARGLNAPLQLTAAGDGRVFVAAADGRVRVVNPAAPGGDTIALDAPALLASAPRGPLGLALHPGFHENGYVYVAYIANDAGGQRLRVVRLREAGDRLGEPATLFEAWTTNRGAPLLGADADAASHVSRGDGPRIAFGMDGLLYMALPAGLEFDGEPSASRPYAAMLRVTDEGRATGLAPLSGVTAHPMGFAWHPATAALWTLLPASEDNVVMRALTGPSSGDEYAVQAAVEGAGTPARTLRVGATAATPMLALAESLGLSPIGPVPAAVRLSVPVLLDGVLDDVSGRIGDVASSPDGIVYVAASDAGAGASGAAGDVVLRLRPLGR